MGGLTNDEDLQLIFGVVAIFAYLWLTEAAEPIQCQWTNASAPFYVTVENRDSSTVKLRSCPKKWDSCTGDMGKPNHYMDCEADVEGQSSAAVLINAGVGYVVVFYKT